MPTHGHGVKEFLDTLKIDRRVSRAIYLMPRVSTRRVKEHSAKAVDRVQRFWFGTMKLPIFEHPNETITESDREAPRPFRVYSKTHRGKETMGRPKRRVIRTELHHACNA